MSFEPKEPVVYNEATHRQEFSVTLTTFFPGFFQVSFLHTDIVFSIHLGQILFSGR